MPKLWREQLSRLRNPSSNQKVEKDSLSNVLTDGVTADATTGSQKSASSKHAVPVVHTVNPDSPITTLLTKPSLLPRNLSFINTETEKLLVDNIDLWDEAYKKLKSEQPELFEGYKRCVLALRDESAIQTRFILDDLDSEQREQHLANNIEKRLQAIQEQEWSTAGDLYKKIVRTVLFAKDFVGQAVSNEPHAALAWAGVSMLLPVGGPHLY
jgi:N-terminal domain of NWD NACHT-NTPase